MIQSTTAYSEKQIEQLEKMEQLHFWNRARSQLILYQLHVFLPSSKRRVLDVGCGTGAFVEQLVRNGYAATGVDLQEEGLRRRKKEKVLDLIQANATQLPFADAQFDAVILADVLEHLEGTEAIQEAMRVLAPHGILLITVPAFQRLWSTRDVLAGHYRRYASADIRFLAKQFDCQISYLGFYQFFLFPIFFLSRFFKIAPQKEQIIPRWINGLFFSVNRFEVWLGRWIRWPWGSSIIAVMQKLKEQEV